MFGLFSWQKPEEESESPEASGRSVQQQMILNSHRVQEASTKSVRRPVEGSWVRGEGHLQLTCLLTYHQTTDVLFLNFDFCVFS